MEKNTCWEKDGWFVITVIDTTHMDVAMGHIDAWAKQEKIEGIYEIFYPTYDEKVLSKKGYYIKKKPLYPQKLFIRMKLTDRTYAFVSRCHYVGHFLPRYNPVPLTDIEVSKLKGTPEKYTKVVQILFTKGDMVEIKSKHPFQGFRGIVEEQIDENVKISIKIFGRDVSTSVHVSNVKKA